METQILGVGTLVPNLIYLVSVVMFIVGIVQMSRVKTARMGNQLAAGAMLAAMIGQAIELGWINPVWVIVGLGIGGVVGAWIAMRVEMTAMPEMVALLNGSGGLASALVGIASYETLARHRGADFVNLSAQISAFNAIALALTVAVGAVTFTGSVVAWAKLSERMRGEPVLFPGRHAVNIVLAVTAIAASGWLLVTGGAAQGWAALAAVTVATSLLGIGLVVPIGGGDMPVVISLLNSYSGVAAALAGFTLNSPVLIVSGSLVGSAGLILTQIMCKAMNRSLVNVLFGGFGAVAATSEGGSAKDYANVKSADSDEAAMILEEARSVIIVPGYGMAVSQAQHAVKELAAVLAKRGCRVRYAIHPVAGRMPGHMNVLLAEADVPYDQQVELEAINSEFRETDVCMVIGANDVVNPVADTDPTSPIYGMPILNAYEAATVMIVKRSLAPGFAMIKNPLFEADNAVMLFGDGKVMIEGITRALKEA